MTHLDGMFLKCFIHVHPSKKEPAGNEWKENLECDGKQPEVGQSDFFVAFLVSW